MEAEEKTFGKDEIIFREGEPSANAYMVVQGHVELTKRGTHGPVLVGLAGPLDFFGETTLFDDTPYDVTARAAEKSRIRIVTRPMLVEWLNTEPGAALRIGTMLGERLRNVHHLILDQSEKQIAKGGGTKRGGFWSLLKKWLKRRHVDRQEEQGKKFLIGLATVNNDVDGAWTRALAALLDQEAELGVRILSGSLQIEPGADQSQAAAATIRARDLLARESELDLLIWGDVHADGYSLWFSPQGKTEDERAGGFSLFTSLELPGDQQPPAGDLLACALLAALEPPEPRRFDQAQLLRYVVGRLEEVMAGALPMSWNLEQQRTALTCYGHALSTLAAADPTGPFAHQAVDAYRAALARVNAEERGMEEAQLHKHMGLLMAAQGDRSGDPAWLDLAVAEFKAGIECLTKARHPQEWGSLQNRLGLALYRLDLMGGGGPDLLKEAMVAFQGALQAFPRQENPERWAEVMHNLAQVLQLYGDQMKSPDVLERAIETARAALELRPRAKVPFAWASSQNTLGTALFMLAKHSKGIAPLDEATEAINGALEVYRQLGAVRQAEVTEKNLAHLTKLTKRRNSASPQSSSSHWFEEGK